jgi:hypothetical protein
VEHFAGLVEKTVADLLRAVDQDVPQDGLADIAFESRQGFLGSEVLPENARERCPVGDVEEA